MRSDGQLIKSTLCHQQCVNLLSVRTSFHDTSQDWQQCRGHDSRCAPGAGSCCRCRGSSSTPASASKPACTTSGTALETVRVRFPWPGSSQDAFLPFFPVLNRTATLFPTSSASQSHSKTVAKPCGDPKDALSRRYERNEHTMVYASPVTRVNYGV